MLESLMCLAVVVELLNAIEFRCGQARFTWNKQTCKRACQERPPGYEFRPGLTPRTQEPWPLKVPITLPFCLIEKFNNQKETTKKQLI